MNSKKDALIFIEHILGSINKIENFMKDVSESDFRDNEEKQSAVIKQIEIIGEATKNLPESFREKYSDVHWSDIVKTRDKFTHHYFGIDLDIVWDIVKINLPELKKQMQEILEKEN